MGMTDGQINDYLAEIRKWPRRPSDYDASTESIIRRYLRGEIELGASGDRPSPPAEREQVAEPSREGAPGSTVADDQLWLKLDAVGNYSLAIDTLRRR